MSAYEFMLKSPVLTFLLALVFACTLERIFEILLRRPDPYEKSRPDEPPVSIKITKE